MGNYMDKPYKKSDSNTKIIDQLVSEMKNDAVLLKNWRKLAHALGLSVNVIRHHEKMDISDRSSEDILRSIVEHWVSVTANPDLSSFCKILRESDFKNVAANIDHRNNKMDGRRIQHDVCKEFSFFLGRKKEQLDLLKAYEDHQSPVCIHGLAGFGKTELAKKFARTMIRERSVNVFFLHGDSDGKLEEGIKKAYEEVTGETIAGSGKRFNVDDWVWSLSSLNGRVVLIVDNVDHKNQVFDSLMNSIKTVISVFVIVTTRDLLAVRRHNEETICLDVFDRATSKEMVRKVLKTNDEAAIDMLCDKTKDCPLALVQATSCIKKLRFSTFVGRSYNIRDYLTQLKVEPYTILGPENKYKNKSLYRIIGLSIRNIESDPSFGKIAKQLIQLLAYLDPDGVQVDNLNNIYVCAYPEQPINIDAGISLLQSYSIITVDRNIIYTHRMTQAIVRLQVSKEETNNCKYTMVDTLVAILEKLQNNFTASEKFQVIKLCDHIYKLNGDIKKQFLSFPVIISNRLIALAYYLIANKFCDKYKQKLVSLNENEENESTLQLRYNSLRSLNYQGHRDDLFTKFNTLLKQAVNCFGEIHKLCFAIRIELACLKKNLGELSESYREYNTIFEDCRSTFGPTSELSLSALHGQAICLLGQEKFQEAEKAFLEVVDKRRKKFSETDPSYLRAYCFLGECRFKMEKYDESKRILLEALKLQFDCQNFHPEHWLTLKSLYFFLKSTEILGEASDSQNNQLYSVFKDDKFYVSILQGLINKLDKDQNCDEKILLINVLEIKLAVVKKDKYCDVESPAIEARLNELRRT